MNLNNAGKPMPQSNPHFKVLILVAALLFFFDSLIMIIMYLGKKSDYNDTLSHNTIPLDFI